MSLSLIDWRHPVVPYIHDNCIFRHQSRHPAEPHSPSPSRSPWGISQRVLLSRAAKSQFSDPPTLIFKCGCAEIDIRPSIAEHCPAVIDRNFYVLTSLALLFTLSLSFVRSTVPTRRSSVTGINLRQTGCGCLQISRGRGCKSSIVDISNHVQLSK